MSEVRQFFRHCPACGRRFHIELVGEKLVDEKRHTEQTKQPVVPPMAASSSYSYGGVPMPPAVVQEDVPLRIDIKDFRYTYKCKHCLPPDVEVITAEGLKRIADVKVGDLVMTHVGRYRPVSQVFRHDYQGSLLEITASHTPNSTIALSPDHPVFTKWLESTTRSFVLQDVLEVKPAGSVVVGLSRHHEQDLLVMPRLSETHDRASLRFGYQFGRYHAKRSMLVPINQALMTVIGYYLSEGNVVSVKRRENAVVRFCFGKNLREFHFANECSEALKDLGFHHRIRVTRDGIRLICDNVALVRFLVSSFGKGAYSKSIPLWTKTLPSALLTGMFDCYLNGDGHRVNRCLSEASTVSKQLAFDVREIALKLGYTVSLYEPRVRTTGMIQGRRVRLHRKYKLKFNNWPSSNKTRSDEKFLYLRMRSLRKTLYSGPLYNLEVEDDNSYCTKAFAVHNCGHVWSEMHERESEA